MTSLLLDLDEAKPVRDRLRRAFELPDPVHVHLHQEGRPAWLLEVAWDGTETVGCGDRFYAEPDPFGFTLVAVDDGRPAGYLSAELSPGPDGDAQAHVEMVQVDADHRGERIGSALAAGLAEILLREMEVCLASGRGLTPWTVSADTVSKPADRLIRRLQRVLDDEYDACLALYVEDEGPEL